MNGDEIAAVAVELDKCSGTVGQSDAHRVAGAGRAVLVDSPEARALLPREDAVPGHRDDDFVAALEVAHRSAFCRGLIPLSHISNQSNFLVARYKGPSYLGTM